MDRESLSDIELTHFQIKPWATVLFSKSRVTRKLEVKTSTTDTDPLNARILKLVIDLGNTVLAKKAASDLHRYV